LTTIQEAQVIYQELLMFMESSLGLQPMPVAMKDIPIELVDPNTLSDQSAHGHSVHRDGSQTQQGLTKTRITTSSGKVF
jgi:hypothetical protein